MKFNIITIFPKLFDSFLQESLIKKSIDKRLINFSIINVRDFTKDKHKKVDDTPYGGGAGMVLKIEPIHEALKKNQGRKKKSPKRKTILLTPTGKQFNQGMADKFSKLDEITFICGRYEGVDSRIDNFIDEKVSIGPYVLNGGEVAAQAIIEATFRLIPGVVGNKESIEEETFSFKKNGELITEEYPHYTRPEVFEVKEKQYKVPKILLSGDHKKIKEWREKKSK
jgi:tRNA (guanine37-N1)-methyltransferase